MKILLLDNYDSFTWNLVQLIEETGLGQVFVKENDALKLTEVQYYDKIILSPGPGLPKEAGLMPEIIAHYFDKKPILGVCLGHQALAEFFGASLYNLPRVIHGEASKLHFEDTQSILFNGIRKENSMVGRYHSWAVNPLHFPEALEITAWADGVIMAFQHTLLPVYGLQFHPESYLTDMGLEVMKNFLKIEP